MRKVQQRNRAEIESQQNQPLKEKGAKIQLFTGGDANYQYLGTAVIDSKSSSHVASEK